MKKFITLKTLAQASAKGIAAALILSANWVFAQVHVKTPTELAVGKDILLQSQQQAVFDVWGSMFVSQEPQNSLPHVMYSGTYFTNHQHSINWGPPHGIINYHTPIMLPQWDNAYWIGKASQQVWRVYSQQLYVNRSFYTSDERLKSNFKPVQNSLSRVLTLKPYSYDFMGKVNENTPPHVVERMKIEGKNQIGFKAQEVKKDFPHLVNYDEEADLYSIDYTGFIPEMVRAMQEQQEMIEKLKAEIEALKGSEIQLENNQVQNTSELLDIEPIAPKQPVVVNYQTENEGAYQIRVYDLAGKQLYKTETLNPTIKSVELPRKKLGAGSYLVTLFKNGEEVNTKKVIILD